MGRGVLSYPPYNGYEYEALAGVLVLVAKGYICNDHRGRRLSVHTVIGSRGVATWYDTRTVLTSLLLVHPTPSFYYHILANARLATVLQTRIGFCRYT